MGHQAAIDEGRELLHHLKSLERVCRNPNCNVVLVDRHKTVQWCTRKCRQDTLYGVTCEVCGKKYYSPPRNSNSKSLGCCKDCLGKIGRPVLLTPSLGRKKTSGNPDGLIGWHNIAHR